MEDKKPLVSIILPVFNSEKFLHFCLKSLIRQSYKNIEIIAIDDNSKDNSFKILKSFRKQDKRLHVSKNIKKYGFPVCLNRALKKAKGQFITFMSANDTSLSQRIEKKLKYFKNNQKAVVVGVQCVFTDQNNKKLNKSIFPEKHEFIHKSLLSGLSMHFETAIINKFLLPKDILTFKENVYPFFYIDLFMRLLPYGEFANLSEFLHRHRKDTEFQGQSVNYIFSIAKLWLKSLTISDYRLPFSNLFAPLTKQA